LELRPSFAPSEAAPVALKPAIDRSARPRFGVVEEWAFGEDGPIAAGVEPDGAGPRREIADEARREVAAQIAPGPVSGEIAKPESLQSASAPTSAPIAAAPSSNSARPKRSSSRSTPMDGLALEASRVSAFIPPTTAHPRNAADVGSQPIESKPASKPAGLEFHVASEAKAPDAETKASGSEAVKSAAGVEASPPSKPAEEDQAQKIEQEKKVAFWRRMSTAQTAVKTKVAAESNSQDGPLLRLYKKVLGQEAPSTTEESAYAALLEQGVKGPFRVRLADRATLWLPSGYVFLGAEQAREAMDAEEGVWDDANQGLVLPATRTPSWAAYVDLLDDGYIKDEGGQSLEPAGLLASLKSNVAALNSERVRNGLAPVTVTDWIKPPKYAAAKHSLGSCVGAINGGAADSNARLVNCYAFTLGRRGAVKVLVAGAESNLAGFDNEAAALAEKITYDQGQTYGDIDAANDRAANYGVAALAGGVVGLKNIPAVVAAAGAGKDQGLVLTRALKYWEEILVALIAIAFGARWLLMNRDASDERDRAAPRTPAWKIAVSLLRANMRRLFEKEAAAPRVFQATKPPGNVGRPERVPAQPDAPPWFALLRERLAQVPLLRKASKDAASQEAPDAALAAEAAPQEAGDMVGAELAPTSLSEHPPAKALAKLASLMRKAEPQGVDLSRAARSRHASASADSEGERTGEEPAPLSAAVAAASGGASTELALDDLFGLVEPGDAEAASLARSARQALERAHG
jgi:uncharacterized membrane-anchored protein